MPLSYQGISTVAISRIIGVSLTGTLSLLGCILLIHHIHFRPKRTAGTNGTAREQHKTRSERETEAEKFERAYEKWVRRWGNPQEDYCRGQQMGV